jgi:hypothetical protein
MHNVSLEAGELRFVLWNQIRLDFVIATGDEKLLLPEEER